MLTISSEQMLSLSRDFEQRQEAPWIEREFRAAYGEALAGLDDEFLRGEIRDCLKRCDELGLSGKADRLLLCTLDIVGFPGFRELPQLPALVARYAGAEESVLLALYREAPPEFWARMLEQSLEKRRERGMP